MAVGGGHWRRGPRLGFAGLTTGLLIPVASRAESQPCSWRPGKFRELGTPNSVAKMGKRTCHKEAAVPGAWLALGRWQRWGGFAMVLCTSAGADTGSGTQAAPVVVSELRSTHVGRWKSWLLCFSGLDARSRSWVVGTGAAGQRAHLRGDFGSPLQL